jgi:hypothetical protein
MRDSPPPPSRYLLRHLGAPRALLHHTRNVMRERVGSPSTSALPPALPSEQSCSFTVSGFACLHGGRVGIIKSHSLLRGCEAEKGLHTQDPKGNP